MTYIGSGQIGKFLGPFVCKFNGNYVFIAVFNLFFGSF